MTKAKAKQPATTRRASKLAAPRSVKAKHVGRTTKRPAASKVFPANDASASPAKATGAPANSRQARVLALLRSTDGCTIKAVVKGTGWQPHSVRGFFADIVRKKLKLDLDSELFDDVRRYRITDPRRTSRKPHPCHCMEPAVAGGDRLRTIDHRTDCSQTKMQRTASQSDAVDGLPRAVPDQGRYRRSPTPRHRHCGTPRRTARVVETVYQTRIAHAFVMIVGTAATQANPVTFPRPVSRAGI